MTEAEIFEAVKEIAAEQLDIDTGTITMDTKIKEDLDADSLDLFEIVSELEDKYDIDLDADEGLVKVSDVVKTVKAELDD